MYSSKLVALVGLVCFGCVNASEEGNGVGGPADGQLPPSCDVTLHFRSFIRAATVAGGLFAGDGRDFSTSLSARSRVHQTVVMHWNGSRLSLDHHEASSSGTISAYCIDTAPTTSRASFSGGILSTHVFAADPCTPPVVTPDVDLLSQLHVRVEDGNLIVIGEVRGDRFPDHEIFIDSQHLFTFSNPDGGVSDLYGDNSWDGAGVLGEEVRYVVPLASVCFSRA